MSTKKTARTKYEAGNIDDLELSAQDIDWFEDDARTDADGFRVTQCVRARTGDRSAINAIKYAVYGLMSTPFARRQEHARQWRERHVTR